MFRRLRLKLTVLYAGMFCAALAFIFLAAYAVIAGNAQRVVREELQATGAVFDRIWQLRFQRLQDSATLSARDYGFREAVATGDVATIASALSNLRGRLDSDVVFLVMPQGHFISEQGLSSTPASLPLRSALETEDAPTGVLMVSGAPHQAVTAPIYAPHLLGWVIVAERLDSAEMDALEQLSAIPLNAVALVQDADGAWVSSDEAHDDERQLDAFINNALGESEARAGLLEARDGRAIALVKPFRSLDGSRSVLVLRYPLSSALAPYRPLFGSLFGIGLAGVCLLALGSWLLARGITQPISKLQSAARRLEAGEHEAVEVKTRDEISDLAESFNAMAASIKERERKITHLAFHDSETRLPNRLALERRLAGATQPQRTYMAAIGVDRFAHMRGAIGYAHANAVIHTLGARLARLAPNAPMGRLSTDVLGVSFLADDEEAARRRVRGLCANLEQSVSLDGQVVDVSISIGVAPSNKDDKPSDLVERASIALDQARAGRAKIAFFDENAYGDPTRNLSLMGDMRRALTTGEIELHYQPKYNCRAGAIDSAEALLRWRHPRRGMIAPDVFVPMAEETGHIRPLTDWTLARAVEDQARLSAAGQQLSISVNISGRLLSDRDFAQSAWRAVKAARGELCFEITETAIIDHPEIALQNIDLFARNGVKIAIDDYGSGLSSLAYLKQLPAHELKIDKLFIQSLTNSQRDALLVRSTIELAHGLGMKVTAEGVETPTAFALLSAMGCDMAQGFLVARPEPLNELLAILKDTRRTEFLAQARKAIA